jgi:homoserine kinase
MGLRTDTVEVTVPATSANLGPGFDALGLALDLRDRVTASCTDGPLRIQVDGEGAGSVPRDETHLVYRAMVRAWTVLGVEPHRVRLHCHNVIPHGRGLGSSSAAIVAGLALGRALVEDGPAGMDDAGLLSLAAELEGHPDNVAPAVLGGLTIAWDTASGSRAVRLVPAATIQPVLLVPPQPLETTVARGLLPTEVSHRDASVNAGRAALLVAALTTRPDLLLDATEDRLHERFREPAMPESLRLVDRLRAEGVPAVVSGAGPTVLALTEESGVRAVAGAAPAGWRVLCPAVSAVGARVATRPGGREQAASTRC